MSEPCIVRYKGQTYDVGAFVDEHPGGRDLIVQLRDQDITEAYDDVGHSKSAGVFPLLVSFPMLQ